MSAATINSAYQAALPQLRQDAVAGTIAVSQALAPAFTAAPANRRPAQPASGTSGGGTSSAWVWVLIGVLAVGGIGGFLLLKRAARRAGERRLAERRASLEPLVDGLAAKITEIGPQVEGGAARAASAQADYDTAVTAYGDAQDALPKAATEGALNLAAAKLETGLRAAGRAEAALAGDPPPAEDAPLLEGLCTFDPKHGPAVTTADITGPSGQSQDVPVCQSCADRLSPGRDPGRAHDPGRRAPDALLRRAGLRRRTRRLDRPGGRRLPAGRAAQPRLRIRLRL